MDPIHISALLMLHVHEEMRRKEIEHHFALRARVRRERGGRIRRVGQLVTRRRAPVPNPQPAL